MALVGDNSLERPKRYITLVSVLPRKKPLLSANDRTVRLRMDGCQDLLLVIMPVLFKNNAFGRIRTCAYEYTTT